ncbi:NAD-dependent protein deacylase [Desulfonema limicola]|uniref:NAD-dependent protein deacylase n=1 Tax=Desulfonema limicola TaxID=45656 RepID=A0A975B6C3_9BACT|nr:NAD-dependent protein deacylase [Desulfonema limicola]
MQSISISAAPFKKGPDYIDAGWLSLAGDQPCYNLDTFLIDQPYILNSFLSRSSKSDIAVIEGNRGLYDCISLDGDTSTAELAKLLKAPVVICLDCTKTTRTMAAVVSGCIQFDPELNIEGVILNKVAGSRHENNLRKNIEHYCGIPVLGALPKLDSQSFPERHMGLVPSHEHEWANQSIKAAALIAKKYLDLDKILEIAGKSAQTLISQPSIPVIKSPISVGSVPRIGIIKDSAFQFYYPENIEALISLGAECIFFSPFSNKSIPDIDGLYIGGGFPETHACQLAENKAFGQELKKLADKGLPIYAECGGLMYLGEKLVIDGISYPMSGVLPIIFGFSQKPQGHGYTIVNVTGDNPYFKTGSQIRGHEFHYSSVIECRGNKDSLVFSMKRGKGIKDKMDGFCYKNVLAAYTHIHALGTPSWADAVVANAIKWKKSRQL